MSPSDLPFEPSREGLLILFLFGFQFRETFLVGQGDIALDDAVVQNVRFAVFQIAEEPDQVDHSSDAEPECRNERHNAGNQQSCDEEIVSPPLKRPRRDDIPDDNQNKADDEVVNETVTEDAPCDDAVAPGIFLGNADELELSR